MTQTPFSSLQDLIIQAVSQKNGANLDEITTKLAISSQSPSRRTLQRRLAELVNTKTLKADGKGRGVRYFLANIQSESSIIEVTKKQSPYEFLVPEESLLIKEYLSQPPEKRKPVAYNPDFLSYYQPNQTAYLSESIRNHLKTIGASTEINKPAGTFARNILNQLLIDLSWNSSRLEGNTYSLLETERLIQFSEISEEKATFETQMILNHKAAIEYLTIPVEPDETEINCFRLLNLHALLSENLLPNPNASGRLRTIPVDTYKSVYYPPVIRQFIEEFFEQIVQKAATIQNPFEQAFFLMVQIPYLQPFEDVNKRVSRLAANIPLIRENLSPLSFIDVSEQSYIDGLLGVYEMNKVDLLRDVFIWAYERSSARYAAIRQTLGEPDPFRFRFRPQIKEIVLQIIQNRISKRRAPSIIRDYTSKHIPSEHAGKFLEVIETELMGLHEGNIARYSITPKEYLDWAKIGHEK